MLQMNQFLYMPVTFSLLVPSIMIDESSKTFISIELSLLIGILAYPTILKK
jgi:hypothetical protein